MCIRDRRSPDPSANPYLAFAVMLAAGLAGSEEELELQEPNEDQDLFMLSRQDLRQPGIAPLPESLGEAVELFAESELMRATLGEMCIRDRLVHLEIAPVFSDPRRVVEDGALVLEVDERCQHRDDQQHEGQRHQPYDDVAHAFSETHVHQRTPSASSPSRARLNDPAT